MIEPHDLLKISGWKGLQTSENESIPLWVKTAIAIAPLVVVRRAPPVEHQIPVGVRGPKRAQRFAAYISPQSVQDHYRPSDLAQWSPENLHLPKAKQTFQEMQALFDQLLMWGPAGSAGFEIATGQQVMTPDSDFDIVMTPPKPIERKEAQTFLEKMDAFPMYVDAQVMVPQGAFSLREWAKGRNVLLKTVNGPQLFSDPWR